MAFDTAIAKVLKRVAEIPGIGETITYQRRSAGSYNAASGTVKESLSDTSLKGVFEDVNLREVTGLVQADDRKCTIAANSISFSPSVADKIVASGKTYQIIRIKLNEQAGTNLSYVFYLRG